MVRDPGRGDAVLHFRFEWVHAETDSLFKFTYNIASKAWQAKCFVHDPVRTRSGGLTYCTRARKAVSEEHFDAALEELKAWCSRAHQYDSKDEHQAMARPKKRQVRQLPAESVAAPEAEAAPSSSSRSAIGIAAAVEPSSAASAQELAEPPASSGNGIGQAECARSASESSSSSDSSTTSNSSSTGESSSSDSD